jgi:hypothetical protein
VSWRCTAKREGSREPAKLHDSGLAGLTNTPILLLVDKTAMAVMSADLIAIENRSWELSTGIIFAFSNSKGPFRTK